MIDTFVLVAYFQSAQIKGAGKKLAEEGNTVKSWEYDP